MDYGMIIRFFGILTISLYIYMKILNIKNVSKLKIVSAIIFSLIMSVPLSYTPFLYEFIFLISVCIFVGITARVKINLMISAVIISVGISLGIGILTNSILMIFHFIIEFTNIMVKVIRENIPPEDMKNINPLFSLDPSYHPIMVIPWTVWESILFMINIIFVNFIFKIKRLKKGFLFLQSKEARWIGIIFSIIIMMSRSFMSIVEKYIDNDIGIAYIGLFLLGAINICTIGIHFWWRHHTTMLYQQRLKEHTIQEHLDIIDEKDK